MNSPRASRTRAGFTLPELLTLVLLALACLALLAPTIHAARDTTAEQVCVARLRAIGKAVDEFEAVHEYYPDSWYFPGDAEGSTTYAGWCTRLLPYLGLKELDAKYRRDKPWWDETNQAVVNEQVPAFVCPASDVPHVRKGLRVVGSDAEFPDRSMAIGDYIILRGYYDYGASPPPVDARVPGMLMGMSDPGAREQAVNIRPRRELVTDGLAHTAMIGERSGRPGFWVNREKVSETNQLFVFDGGWATYQSVWPRTFEDDGKTIVTSGVGPRTINCNNGFGVYAFHQGGANTLFGDGAVHFLNEKIDSYVFLALLSRQRGEVLQASDY